LLVGEAVAKRLLELVVAQSRPSTDDDSAIRDFISCQNEADIAYPLFQNFLRQIGIGMDIGHNGRFLALSFDTADDTVKPAAEVPDEIIVVLGQLSAFKLSDGNPKWPVWPLLQKQP